MVTIDTNIAIYALAQGDKAPVAKSMLVASDFLSTQVLNEFAASSRRKLRREWSDIANDLDILRNSVGQVVPIPEESNRDALRLAARYQLNFYDAVMIAVALANGATTLFSEDMQHGMVIDGKLIITNPFLAAEPV
jgi:predicted nucleic acid-binding protein